MKFTKLTKKLLLSALSLGLAVVTLTTTTFAWYTSSTEAGAVGQGETSGTTQDSTLEITTAYDGNINNSTWTKNVTVAPSGLMTPVAWNGTSFVDVDNTAATDYYQFKLWFKTTKTTYDTDIAVYLKNMVITNTTEGEKLPEYNNLLSNMQDRPNTVPAGSTYAIDAVRALDMVVDSNVGKVAYELSNLFTYATSKEKGYASTLDASAYYQLVMGSSPNAAASGSLTPLTHDSNELTVTSTGQYVQIGNLINKAETTSYDVLEVTFTIFLNGWDNYCFDACKGQSFSVSLDFTTAGKNISQGE